MRVYFIGAGPGAWDLLTLRALNILKKADVVIYAGSLVNKDILKQAKKNALIFDSSRMHLKEVLAIFKKMRATKKIIARIHSGDPVLYGAIQEQMDWLNQRRIYHAVIPGVSSYQALAATLRQELTLPGVSQSVILTRLSGRTKVPPDEDLEKLARHRATMIIFLSVQEIRQVAEKLKKGYPLNTPVVVVEKVSLPGERKIRGTLNNIAEKVKAAGIKRQALILVGDILKKKYQRSKLYDKGFEHMFRKERKR